MKKFLFAKFDLEQLGLENRIATKHLQMEICLSTDKNKKLDQQSKTSLKIFHWM
jgi:hypothetical protein